MGGTDTARLRGTFTQAKKGNRLAVLLAVGAGLGIAGAHSWRGGRAGGREGPQSVLLPGQLPIATCPAAVG